MPDADVSKAVIYNITADGNEYIADIAIENNVVIMKLDAGQAVVIKCME